MNRVRHIFRLIGLAVMLHLTVSVASAASLENIEVNSRLGEPFFAEIPLQLESNELVSKVFVEIAAASDYKIFEVYRDPELNAMRADVESDARGVRVKLSSRTAINAPFFNLIVKIRHGRVAHFKKYPVFLEAPKTVVEAAERAPVPVVEAVAQGEHSGAAAQPPAESTKAAESAAPKAYAGWARTDRYGPIVRGDVLSTVAQRLRIDRRYSNYQVMAALYDKNRTKFDQNNMNLLLKDSFLTVPTADEVEKLTAREAYKLFTDHENEWKQLNQQPRYAAEAEAQRTRYSKRVRMGDQADGVAATPVASTSETMEEKVAAADQSGSSETVQDGSESGTTDELSATAVDGVADQQVSGETEALLEALKEQNELLQQKLEQSEQSIAALSQKVDEAASAASKANVERLEILVARMQGELEKAKAQAAQQPAAAGMDWVVWLLIALVVVLLIVVALLMRREPAHPADALVDSDLDDQGSDQVEAAVAAATAVAAASESTRDEAPENELTEHVEEALEPEIAQSVEEAVEAVEDDADIFESISSFPEDLTDTDTAEMEPFDSSLIDEAPDPNIDYLSEAEVYTRYGMEDEAVQQLDMALRLKPDHADAHIKKAELFYNRGDAAGFNSVRLAALAALTGAGLDQFNAATSGYIDMVDDSLALDVREQAEEPVAEIEPAIDSSEQAEAPSLDYDFSELGEDLGDIEVEPATDGETREFQTADISDFEEMDWLHDASFEDEVQESAAEADEIGGETIALTPEDGATQMIDSILDDFNEAESDETSLAEDEIDTEQKVDLLPDSEGTLDLAAIGATQELDNLLNAFSEETDEDGSNESVASDADAVAGEERVAGSEIDLEREVTATQHLDNLLGEFTDDDDSMFEGEEELITATSEVPVLPADEPADTPEEESIFGATQHLDVLMSEFAGNEEDTIGGVDFDTEKTADDEPSDESDALTGEDPGATQQLDHLLGEFSAMEAGHHDQEDEFEGLSFDRVDHLSEDTDEIEVDHCATQELDHLLSEFADDEDETDSKS